MVWTTRYIPNLHGKTAVVTGANSGLGLVTARALAGAGAKVLLACRSRDKGELAMTSIREQHPEADLTLISLDLASLKSVQTAAGEIADKLDALDILVNNAGIMAVPYRQTEDGFEAQIGTNHFGHFALTGRLLPQLKAAPSARVVNVSSMAHRWTPGINFDDLDWQNRRYRRWQAYGDSKLANLYFSAGLKKRLSDTGITVASAHPGYSATNLQLVAAEEKNNPFEKVMMQASNWLVGQSADMGALPSLYAATVPEVQSGDFIGPDGFQQMRGHPTKVRARRLAGREDLADQLWALSCERTEVAFTL